ncbi:DUF2290 domain-containing protein [Azospirillum halopraeferens]|uniref:DUF2290 domain-containing protein n=1 Tax=Azospirillum halopraeferens TaxID=34010 RepID=UPI000A01E77C|nr:DUF2290 domain-containing protein [Azospirillum halopraeferens]
MNPRSLCGKLNEFFINGFGEGVFRDIQHHSLSGSAGALALGPSVGIGMYPSDGISIDEYLDILEARRFSALLYDYALVSVECIFSGKDLIKHRYIYFPCPVAQYMMHQCPESMPTADWVREAVMGQGVKIARSLGFFRFDYAPKQKGEMHPASHFTFMSSGCRIPVQSPMGPADFFNFVFDNFHPKYSGFWRQYASFLGCAGVQHSIERDEMIRQHISWVDDL